MKKQWFSAKGVFVHRDSGSGPRQLYEERVLLVRARTFRKARKLAEKDAQKYERLLDGCAFTEFVEVFRLFDEPGDGAEVFSTMEQSDLEPKEYVERRYPSKPADCEAEGREHRYYNNGHGYSACYHCSVVKPGELWH
jgi:hypothetical protein